MASNVKKLGPTTVPTPAVPNCRVGRVAEAFTNPGTRYADVSNHCNAFSPLSRPLWSRLPSAMRSARLAAAPVGLWPTPAVTVNGAPDCHVPIPDNCQPPSAALTSRLADAPQRLPLPYGSS